MLEEGERAPNFELPAQDGNVYTLEKFESEFLILYLNSILLVSEAFEIFEPGKLFWVSIS